MQYRLSRLSLNQFFVNGALGLALVFFGVASQAQTATTVVIDNFAFNASQVTIKVGDSVTWNNKDGSSHTVTLDNEQGDSKSIEPSSDYTQRFDKSGVYDYHCSFHPYMTGKVVVK